MRRAIHLVCVIAALVAALATATPPLGAATNPIATPTGLVRFYFHALDTHQCLLASKFGARSSRSLTVFLRSCRAIRHAAIDRLEDPGYRLRPLTASYTCLAVRYTIYRRAGPTTAYGGWYLMERTLGPAWSVLYSLSHVVPGGNAILLSRDQCASHLPSYVHPGAGTVMSGSAFLSDTRGWIALSTSGSYLPNGSCSHGIGSNCESAATTVYRTADAGRHWASLLHITTAVGPPVWIRLFSRQAGLVAATVGPLRASSYAPSTSALFSTHDGGRHWQRFSLPANYATEPGSISFPDPSHGWVWYGGAAMGQMALQMYRTGDGGRHWARVYCTLIAPNPKAPFVCPHPGSVVGGLATDLVFTGPWNGWLTAYENSGVPDLYHTTDGGLSWRRQAVGLPAGIAPPTAQRQVFPSGELLPPRFFGSIGLLPETVGFYRPKPEANWSVLYVFHSKDGGRTWPSALRTRVSGLVSLWQAVDARHWVFITAPPSGAPQTIWSTANSGASWTHARLHAPPGLALVALHLIDARNGWATAQRPADREASALGTVLLHTTDSGVHWTQVTLPG